METPWLFNWSIKLSVHFFLKNQGQGQVKDISYSKQSICKLENGKLTAVVQNRPKTGGVNLQKPPKLKCKFVPPTAKEVRELSDFDTLDSALLNVSVPCFPREQPQETKDDE